MTEPAVITQKMVADALKIGKTTVSLALSNNPRIPLKTRDKVHAMAQRMGYKPHPFLTDLIRQRWKHQKRSQATIAYLCEARHMKWGSAYETFKGVLLQAAKLGYQVDSFYFNEYRSAASLQKILIARGIDALLINGIKQKNVFLELDWSRFITVFAHSRGIPPPLHAVVQNHYGNLIKAWEKAVEYGYTRIGTILLNHGTRLIDDDLRMAGVVVCQKRLFPNLAAIEPLEMMASSPGDDLKALKQIRLWLKKNKPDVVIGFHGGYRYYLDDLGYDSLGFINLHLPQDPKSDACYFQSGIEFTNELIGIETVNLLDMCRKTNQWGIPSRRIEHAIDSVWRDGSTLPRKE